MKQTNHYDYLITFTYSNMSNVIGTLQLKHDASYNDIITFLGLVDSIANDYATGDYNYIIDDDIVHYLTDDVLYHYNLYKYIDGLYGYKYFDPMEWEDEYLMKRAGVKLWREKYGYDATIDYDNDEGVFDEDELFNVFED